MRGERENLTRKITLFLIGGTLGALILGAWQYFIFFDGRLHVTFCDVGQGDAIYLRTPKGADILIDGGPNDRVLACLGQHMPFWDRQLELVVLTHPQADHLTGLISVFENYQVKYFLTENLANSTAVFAKFRQRVIQENTQVVNPKQGEKIKIGGVEMETLWPKEVIGEPHLWQADSFALKEVLGISNLTKNPNAYSLVFDIKYGDFDILTTGDSDSQTLIQALAVGVDPIEVFQVPHHGSKFGLTKAVLEKTNPHLAVISVGKNNRFGHPAPQVLELLVAEKIKIFRTDQEGEVNLTTDGKNWQVK